MKTLKIISALLVIAMAWYACEQEEEANPTTNSTYILGDWTVSSFVKGNEDITGEFSPYTFSCSKNGKMTIQGSGKNYNCTWDNMNNNDSLFHFQIMGCGPNSVLLECADDWDLIEADSLHCYFTSHDPEHHRVMAWNRSH